MKIYHSRRFRQRRGGTENTEKKAFVLFFLTLTVVISAAISPAFEDEVRMTPHFSTFSIVALDPATGQLGIAVTSKFPAVGNGVPWAKAGVGAVATQALANLAYGDDGLKMMAAGLSAEMTLQKLLEFDTLREERQVGLVDAKGGAATFTGKNCFNWAGGKTGKYYACQGNILTGPDVVDSMSAAYERTAGRPLAERLLTALAAGQKVGGDRRGRESAAILVVKEKGGYGGYGDRWLDLRVDDHPDPVKELLRLYYDVHQLYFGETDTTKLHKVDKALCTEIQTVLKKLGYYKGEVNGAYDAATRRAFFDWQGWENLEMRWREDDRMDDVVLKYMREHYGRK